MKIQQEYFCLRSTILDVGMAVNFPRFSNKFYFDPKSSPIHIALI